MTLRITEQKLRNKRFLKSEETTIVTLLSVKEMISMNRFIRLAKISRSTINRHHGNLQSVAPDYEKYLMNRCRSVTKRLRNDPSSELKALFFRVLIFLFVNRLYVTLVLEKGNHNVIEKLILILKPKILASSQVSDGEMFDVYLKEISGLIEAWCRAGFNKKSLSATVAKITYLTDTANIRLSPLASFNNDRSLGED